MFSLSASLSLTSTIFSFILAASSLGSRSLNSSILLSVPCKIPSAWLMASTLSLLILSAAGLDDNLLFLASSLVSGVDIHNSVSINIKGDLHLWDSPGCWGDACQLELSQHLVVLGHLSLALVDLQFNLCLTISSGGEHLGLLSRDGGVSVDQLGEDSSQSLNSKGQRGNVKEKNISDITSKYTSLDGRSHCYSLVRVDRLAGCATKDILAGILHLGHSGHTSNKDNLANIRLGNLSILHGFNARINSFLDQISNNLFKLCPGQFNVHVLGAGCVHGQVW